MFLSTEDFVRFAATISTDAVAEKFIRYYWRQAMPYPAVVDTRVLQQNTGRQAAVLNVVRRALLEPRNTVGLLADRRSGRVDLVAS